MGSCLCLKSTHLQSIHGSTLHAEYSSNQTILLQHGHINPSKFPSLPSQHSVNGTVNCAEGEDDPQSGPVQLKCRSKWRKYPPPEPFPFSLYILLLAFMNLLSLRPAARSFYPTTINCGNQNGAFGVGLCPKPLQLRLNPLKSSVNNDFKLSFFHSGLNNRKKVISRFQHFVPSALAETSSADGHQPSNLDTDKKLAVVAWSATTMLLAVSTRVLQKLALVPMKEYPFFLAQFNSFTYVAVYFTVLCLRYRTGITTDEMLALPKSPFIAIGFLESISLLSAMYAGAILPGPAIPLLYQTFLVWQLIFSSCFLGRRYSLNQILGCFLVAAGVIVAVTSGGNNGQMLSGIGPLWPMVMIASSAFQAGASIVKESVFVGARTRLKGKPLDVFIVSSFGSGFQALFILLLLPILSNLKGIPISELPSYFKSGVGCFLNIGTNTTGCDGAPLLPLLYIMSNLLFNISILNLLKASNAIVASLASRASVPIAILVLSLPLPYLPRGVNLSPSFLVGSMILMAGLVLYNAPWTRKHKSNIL
ncbi:CRT (chloroquine-resistance transporter)-liketransporter 2 [Striga asiatica]|uniref:CRT (Chloroquine-resistance transporter)-liketransporter 2 n=1 Tax=Striga asiatica TaxID=4170 RepID=A0A5A7QV86_STRAF|nr:CRT (chloroquine-resistance transporter)-liketransporter 2 [Striga asiatica]